MQGELTITLNQLRFHAYHGLYAEEKNAGNDFVVNLVVSYLPGQNIVNALDETIDYGALFAILKSEMQRPRHLLETFVMETAEIIHTRFPAIRHIEISMEKVQVPLSGFTGTAQVTFSKKY